MAENIVESIIVKLGLDGSQYNREADKAVDKNQKLNKSVSETDKVVGTVTRTLARWFSVLSVATGVAKMIDEVQRLNDELFFLEKNLGMSAGTIKNWQGAAGAMGGSAQGMTESIKSLNMGMNDFVTMGDTTLLPFMNALGVGMVDAQGKLRKTDDVMLDLADSFSKMDREQAFSIASKIGIDEGTFNTLVQGRKEVEKMLEYQSKMYKSSEEELKASRQLAQNRALLGQHWESLKTMMANAIIPLFVKLSEVALGIFEYLQEHQQAVQAVFKGISVVIGAILIPILAKATIAALAFIAPFAPFILVVGALGAAFGLLYDDYKTWAEGGKSLFDWGAFRKYIDDATLSTDNLKNSFKNLTKEILSSAMPTLQGYAEVIQKLLSGDFKGAGSQAWAMVKQFGANVAGVVDDLTGQQQGTLVKAAGNLINPTGSASTAPTSASHVFDGGGGSSQSSNVAPVKKLSGSVAHRTMQVIRGHEGFSSKPYWDVNAYRAGYGSDTYTDASGKVHRVTKTSHVSRDDAERDLVRRSAIFANAARKKVGASVWDKLPMDTQAALTSVAYNYGSLSNSLVKTIRTGDLRKIAEHVRSWQYHNKGVNKKRRNAEADLILSSISSGASQAQQSMRQGDVIDLTRVKANQDIANKANEVQVNIGDINVQTSSSTVTGTVGDAMSAVKERFYQFQTSFK